MTRNDKPAKSPVWIFGGKKKPTTKKPKGGKKR